MCWVTTIICNVLALHSLLVTEPIFVVVVVCCENDKEKQAPNPRIYAVTRQLAGQPNHAFVRVYLELLRRQQINAHANKHNSECTYSSYLAMCCLAAFTNMHIFDTPISALTIDMIGTTVNTCVHGTRYPPCWNVKKNLPP